MADIYIRNGILLTMRGEGLGDKIGSLEAGKKADIIITDLKAPHMVPIITRPVRNVAPNIVYYSRGDEVETVIVTANPSSRIGVASPSTRRRS